MTSKLNRSTRLKLEQFLRQNVDKHDLPNHKKEKPRDITPLLKYLTPAQKKILNHPSKRKAVKAGRRFGKTTLAAIALIKRALARSNAVCVFVAPSIDSARRLIWNALVDLSERFSLEMRFDNGSSIVYFPNGSRILLKGVGNHKEASKLYGDKYDITVIDEAQSAGSFLQYLIEDVLDPASQDFQGEIWTIGTTNAACTGFFHQLTTTQTNFAVFAGTVFDNPKYPLWAKKKAWKQLAQEWWQSFLKERNWTEEHPVVRRQWFAEWYRDMDSLVLPFDDNDNIFHDLPDEEYSYVIGVDIGWNDETAFSVLAYSATDPTVYIVACDKGSEWTTDKKISRLNALIARYDPDIITCDPGGGGKIFIGDMNNKYGLNIQVAQKTDKVNHLQMLADDFLARRVKISSELVEVIDELKLLEYSDKPKGKIAESYKQDAFDSILYAWRETLFVRTDTPQEEIDKYHPQYGDEYARKLAQRLLEEEDEDRWRFA